MNSSPKPFGGSGGGEVICTLERFCLGGEVCGDIDLSFVVGRDVDGPAVVVPVTVAMAGFLPANQSPESWDMGRLLDLRLGMDGFVLESRPWLELVRVGMSAAGLMLEFESDEGRFW